MHKANISHRDLHCGNVLIDNEGHLVVIDYGISKWLSHDIDATKLDWLYLSNIIFDIDNDVKELLKNMTDAKLPGKVFKR